MSIERDLAGLDYKIEAARGRIEAAYAVGFNEEEKDRAWAEPEVLVERREYLRSVYSGTRVPWELAWRVFVERVSEVFAELGRKIVEFAEPRMAAFSRLSEAAGLISAALKRLMKEGEASRKPGPRQIYSPAAVGVGPIGVAEFPCALPATRRPVLRGFQRQKGKA